jgi:hypothetical protein
MVNWKKKSPADTPAGLKTRMRVRISLMPQENIPCKSLMTVRRIGVSTPSEDVAVTVAASRFFIGPSDSLKAVRKALQLLRLGEAVVVSINPEQELLEDFIPGIDCTVKVSAHSGRVQIAQHRIYCRCRRAPSRRRQYHWHCGPMPGRHRFRSHARSMPLYRCAHLGLGQTKPHGQGLLA